MNNKSEEVHVGTTESDENSQLTLPPLHGPPPLPIASILVGLVTGVTGMCANAVVFVVLVFARRHFGGNVSMLIANQSAMDLFACVCLVIAFGMSFPGASQNYLLLGQFGNDLVCFLFRNRVLAIVCMNAGKIGLAMIKGGGLRVHGMVWKNNDLGKDRSCGHHLGTLRQSCPCNRSPKVLSPLDD